MIDMHLRTILKKINERIGQLNPTVNGVHQSHYIIFKNDKKGKELQCLLDMKLQLYRSCTENGCRTLLN